MNTDNLMPLLYIGAAGICGIAALATAIIFTAKKKATKSLISYAVLVALLLGGGFLASNNNPIPTPRHTTPEADYAQPDRRSTTPDYILRARQADTPQPAVPRPEPEVSQAEDVEPVIEPVVEPAAKLEPEQSPDEPEAAEEPAPVRKKPSTAKISTPSMNQESEQIPSREPATAQPVYPTKTAPVRTPQPSFGLDENPTLAPDPTIDTMPNPAVLYDPAWLAVQGDRDNGFVPPQNDNNGSENKTPDSSGGSSSATYTHDFSNGRVLASKASDNNGKPVYHTRDCGSAQNIKKENEIWYDSAEDAKADKRQLCERCAG